MGLSFEAAFEAEFAALYRYVRRRVGEAAAEDVAAATFATAYARRDRFDQSRPLRPWLYGIAANTIRHHWRSERRLLRAYARTGVDPIGVEDPVPAGHRELAAALAELRREDRELLLLHAWADLSDAEIAEALSLPVGTVKSRLHRLKERLGNRIGRDGQSALA